MPGTDWTIIENEYIDSSGAAPTWYRESDLSDYSEPLIQDFMLDDIEFDATEIYKTYYLDDRATCHEQGLIIAGKGVRSGKKFWEIYHNGINVTDKIFEALNYEQSELNEIGLI